MITLVVWLIVALLALFSASVVVLVSAEASRLRRRGKQRKSRSLSRRLEDYFGPIDLDQAPLNAPLRIGVEFFAALLGFPGIGWMVSGRMKVGLPLVVIAPALLWMLYPLYISSAGVVLDRPLQVLAVLPPLAVFSAGALALAEMRRVSVR